MDTNPDGCFKHSIDWQIFRCLSSGSVLRATDVLGTSTVFYNDLKSHKTIEFLKAGVKSVATAAPSGGARSLASPVALCGFLM